MRRYTKADVDFHAEHFRPSRPAVNVKVQGRITREILETVATPCNG